MLLFSDQECRFDSSMDFVNNNKRPARALVDACWRTESRALINAPRGMETGSSWIRSCCPIDLWMTGEHWLSIASLLVGSARSN